MNQTHAGIRIRTDRGRDGLGTRFRSKSLGLAEGSTRTFCVTDLKCFLLKVGKLGVVGVKVEPGVFGDTRVLFETL